MIPGLTVIEQEVATVTVPERVTGPPRMSLGPGDAVNEVTVDGTSGATTTWVEELTLPVALVAVSLKVNVAALVVLGFDGMVMGWLSVPPEQLGAQGPPEMLGVTEIEQVDAPESEPESVIGPPAAVRAPVVGVNDVTLGSEPASTEAEADPLAFPTLFVALILNV